MSGPGYQQTLGGLGLAAEGYRPGTPPAGLGGDAADVDGPAARESHCPECGRTGRDYRPWYRPAHMFQPGSYRAFACCAACGHVEEF